MKPDDGVFEDEFMKELRSAIADRNATIDEVIAFIRKKTYDTKTVSMDIDRLASDIAALKTPERL